MHSRPRLRFPMPLFPLPEHKIEVFVRFCPSKPPFSGISSTKSRFLCAFASKFFPIMVFMDSLASSFFPMALRHGCASHKALRNGAPASNKPHPAEKSTPVWLAIWHIWAGFANSQLQCATFHSNYSYKCTSTLLPPCNRCSDIANLSAHLHRLLTPPPYLRRMRLLHGLGAGIRWMMRL